MSDKERVVKALDEAKEGTSVDRSIPYSGHKTLENGLNKENDLDNVIKPEHYNKGEIDLIEAWSLLYPENEFRAGLQMLAMRYMFRDKDNRVVDLKKAIEVIERQIKFEQERQE